MHVPVMSDLHRQPAARIIEAFGGVNQVAAILDLSTTQVRRFRLPPPTGTGGVIDPRHAVRLIAAAKERGVNLEWNDFEPAAPADSS